MRCIRNICLKSVLKSNRVKGRCILLFIKVMHWWDGINIFWLNKVNDILGRNLGDENDFIL